MSVVRTVVRTIAPHLSVPIGPVEAEESPSFPTKLRRLIAALRRWKKAGKPITPRAELDLRRAACATCDLYNPQGNFGFGQCNAPGCGCTKFKAWLADEKCPHPKGSRWPQMQPPALPAKQ